MTLPGDQALTVPATQLGEPTMLRGAAPKRKRRLGEALVESGVLTQAQVASALAAQQREGGPRRRLGEIVVATGLATEADIARGLAELLGLDYLDEASLRQVATSAAVQRMELETIMSLKVLPLQFGGTWVRLAVADPTDTDAQDRARRELGVPSVSLSLATPTELIRVAQALWATPESAAAMEREQARARPVQTDPVLAPRIAGSVPGRRAAEPAAPAAPATGASTSPASPAPVAASPASEATGARLVERRQLGQWKYLIVGDALPEQHPGHVRDVVALGEALNHLGSLGWRVVSHTAHEGRHTAVLEQPRRLDEAEAGEGAEATPEAAAAGSNPTGVTASNAPAPPATAPPLPLGAMRPLPPAPPRA